MSDAVVLQYPSARSRQPEAASVVLNPAMAAIVLTDLAFVQSFCERNDLPASQARDDLVTFLRRNLEPEPPPRRPARTQLFASLHERRA